MEYDYQESFPVIQCEHKNSRNFRSLFEILCLFYASVELSFFLNLGLQIYDYNRQLTTHNRCLF